MQGSKRRQETKDRSEDLPDTGPKGKKSKITDNSLGGPISWELSVPCYLLATQSSDPANPSQHLLHYIHKLIVDFTIKFPDLKDVAVYETLFTFSRFKIAPPIIGYFFVEFKSDPEFKKLDILFTHFDDISNALKYNDNNFQQLLDSLYNKHVSSNSIKKMIAILINFCIDAILNLETVSPGKTMHDIIDTKIYKMKRALFQTVYLLLTIIKLFCIVSSDPLFRGEALKILLMEGMQIFEILTHYLLSFNINGNKRKEVKLILENIWTPYYSAGENFGINQHSLTNNPTTFDIVGGFYEIINNPPIMQVMHFNIDLLKEIYVIFLKYLDLKTPVHHFPDPEKYHYPPINFTEQLNNMHPHIFCLRDIEGTDLIDFYSDFFKNNLKDILLHLTNLPECLIKIIEIYVFNNNLLERLDALKFIYMYQEVKNHNFVFRHLLMLA